MGELAKSGYAASVVALPQVYIKCSFTAGVSKRDILFPKQYVKHYIYFLELETT
jgi:hypothetical protein